MAQPVAPPMPVLPPEPPTISPSGWWYALTVGIGVIGLMFGISALVDGSREARSTLRDVTVVELGSSATVTFDKVDRYTLYYLGELPDNGSSFQGRAVYEGVHPQLLPIGGGPALELRPVNDGTVFVGRGGQQRIAIATFRVEALGDYTLTSDNFGQGTTSTDSALAIQGSPLERFAGSALRAILLIGGGGLVSVIGSVALGFARGRTKRALAAAGPAPGAMPWRAGDPYANPWASYPPGYAPGAPRPGPIAAPIVPPPPPGYGPPDGR